MVDEPGMSLTFTLRPHPTVFSNKHRRYLGNPVLTQILNQRYENMAPRWNGTAGFAKHILFYLGLEDLDYAEVCHLSRERQENLRV